MNEATEKPGVNKWLLITLGVVAVAALVFLFVVSPLLAGDDTAVPEAAAPADTAGQVAVAPEPTVAPTTEPEPVTESFEVFTARDPFEQLVDDDASAAAPTTDPVTDPSEAAAPTTQVDGTTIELVDVYEDAGVERVQVTVNGSGYEAAEGELIAERVEVLEIDGQCGTFEYDHNRFVLCEGEHIRK